MSDAAEMRQEHLQADEFVVVARHERHGGYAQWRAPIRAGHKGKTTFGLLHCGRWAATLGVLESGDTDATMAEFWARALRRMRKMGLSEAERHDVARQLVRKDVPWPEAAAWPGSDEPQWGEVVEELAGLIQDSALVA